MHDAVVLARALCREGGGRLLAGQRVTLLVCAPVLLGWCIGLFVWARSLDKSKDFSVRRETAHPAVIPHLPYFVKPDFGKRMGRDLYKVESAVEQYTYSKLRRDCSYSRQKRQQYAELAKRSSGQRAQSYMEKVRGCCRGQRRLTPSHRTVPRTWCLAGQRHFPHRV